MTNKHSDDNNGTTRKPSLSNIILSTLAAFIGIQSDKNRQKDFSQKSFIPFFIAGVILITLFYIVLVFIAKQISP